MSHYIKVASRKEFDNKELLEMHRLRTKVFKVRMGWEVSVISGMEIDGYDALDPYYMMIWAHTGNLRGCWRALPTEGPYMLKDTFPELLRGQMAPSDSKIWEISRFAIETEDSYRFGFAELSLDALREIVTFGDKMGIEHYVTVTTASFERLLLRAGISLVRLGPPIRIGIENAVALNIDIGEQTHEALFGKILHAA